MQRPFNIRFFLINNRTAMYIYTFLFLFLYNSNCSAQGKEANVWYFGAKAGVDFNNGSPPTALTDSKLSVAIELSSSSSIADSNGNLQFYSRGDTIWNMNHSYMHNGGIATDFMATYPLIIPMPNNTRYYYHFNFRSNSSQGNLFEYSLIDMDMNYGLGAVIDSIKSIPLLDNATYMIGAVLHANGRDVWVTGHKYTNNSYYSFLITPDSIHSTPVISYIGSVMDDYYGYMKFSPNGEKIVTTIYTSTSQQSFFEMVDFNDETGEVTNIVLEHIDGIYFGVEFSPDNSKLYISGWQGIYQYDLNAGTPQEILDSKFIIDIPNPDTFMGGALQLGIDGKIYWLWFNIPFICVSLQEKNHGFNFNQNIL